MIINIVKYIPKCFSLSPTQLAPSTLCALRMSTDSDKKIVDESLVNTIKIAEQLQKNVERAVNIVKPYEHISFIISRMIEVLKLAGESQTQTVKVDYLAKANEYRIELENATARLLDVKTNKISKTLDDEKHLPGER